MTAEAQPAASTKPMPEAPTKLSLWFPAAEWIRKYAWGTNLTPDLIAAISVAALLIPESMGYASVAGVPVQMGLYAAPLALIAYALFGGSRLMVFAAAGATSAISASIVAGLSGGDQNLAITLTIALAFTTGVVYIIAGLVRLGWITNFMSKAVMAGFILGMAIQIIVGQLDKMFGVHAAGESTVQELWSALSQIGDWDLTTTIIGVGSLLLIFAIQRFMPKLPAALTAVVLSSLLVAILNPDIELVAAIPRGLPSLSIPTGIDPSTWLDLLLAAGVVILVGFPEGWGASAKIADKTHDELDTNQEFRAYGIGNIGAGLLGGMTVTGSLSKSAAAMASGAKSQMANIFLAGFVLLTLAFFAPLFQWLPEAVLAAVVINAMWESASPKKLMTLWRIDRVDFAAAFITFILVLFLDLLPALIVGIVMSVVYMIYRVSFPGRAVMGRVEETGNFEAIAWQYGAHKGTTQSNAKPVPGVIVYRFTAPLIFSNAEAFKKTGKKLLIDAGAKNNLPHTMIIDCEEISYIDTTGSDAIKSLLEYAQRYEVELFLARVHSGTHKLLELTGVLDEIGEERIFHTVRAAVDQAVTKAQTKSQGEIIMIEKAPRSLVFLLLGLASMFIIAAGIKASASILNPILLAAVITIVVLPAPKYLT